jgi:transcription elongation factor SPT6
MAEFLDNVAELGSEEDEDFDEEMANAHVQKKRNGAPREFDDSSEEEDDEEDEEAARKIAEGFIVDEDEEEDAVRERRRKKKRRRSEREEEALDEEDLDLLAEANPEFERKPSTQSKFKRLKQGHREDRGGRRAERGVDDIFSDEEEEEVDELPAVGYNRRTAINDEFADFIEEDDIPDDERDRLEDELEVARPGAGKGLRGAFANLDISTLDEAALEDYRAAFGTGDEYEWALEMEQEAEIDEQERNKDLELKDVFEPSVLVEKLMTETDDEIRFTDIPERFQLARRSFKELILSEEEAAERQNEEAIWVANLLAAEKRIDTYRLSAFQKAVAKVLEFLNVDNYEVPFIKQYRKDHLIYPIQIPNPDRRPDEEEFVLKEERMINDGELWDVYDADIKFRGLMERRDAVQRAYDGLKRLSISDRVVDALLPSALNINEIQDLQDYINFQYSSELKDATIAEANGTQKRPRAVKSFWEKIRTSRAYNLVRAFGIAPDALAQDLKTGVKRTFSDDPTERPVEMADELLDPPSYSTGDQVLRAARAMIIEEFAMSPRLRKYIRDAIFKDGVYDCVRTEKGARTITEDHRYYDFKYLRNQPLRRAGQESEMFLRMLKAESEGLVNVRIKVSNFRDIQKKFRSFVASDNLSEVAEAWNQLRSEIVDEALERLFRLVSRGVKDTLKTGCEDKIAKECREKLRGKLDQAPFKPLGLGAGTRPNVLAMSAGQGVPNRDAICWCYVDNDNSRLVENGKFTDIRLGNKEKYIADGKDVEAFVDLVKRRNPEVIAISGFSVEARKLLKDVQDIVERERLEVIEVLDEEEKRHPVPVTMVNDECARLYYTTQRAADDNPSLATLTRYCYALARYLQNPTLEYIALGKNLRSISLHPAQELLPKDKLDTYIEMALVDVVNMTGVMLNAAVDDPSYTGMQLQYVCGLGPRKVTQIMKAAASNVNPPNRPSNRDTNHCRTDSCRVANWLVIPRTTSCRPSQPKFSRTVPDSFLSTRTMVLRMRSTRSTAPACTPKTMSWPARSALMRSTWTKRTLQKSKKATVPVPP